MTTCF